MYAEKMQAFAKQKLFTFPSAVFLLILHFKHNILLTHCILVDSSTVNVILGVSGLFCCFSLNGVRSILLLFILFLMENPVSKHI